MGAAQELPLSYAEYLAREQTSAVRHEYADGVLWAMAGGTPAHARLGSAVTALLYNLLRPGRGRCRVYSADARVHVAARGSSYYPDASVVCGPVVTSPDDEHAITNPVLLVEVLSDATEARDRGRKFRDYQQLPTLRHYVMVAQDEHRVEHYRRNDDGTWTLVIAGPGDTVQLPDLGGAIEVDELYVGERDEQTP